MTNPTQPRRQANLASAAVVSATAAAAVLLYRFPPESNGFYPQCPFHALTGLLCPGCGATRAIAALVHGHVVDALHLNALVVLLLPILAAYGIAAYWRVSWPRIPNLGIFALLIVTLAFAVVRNLA